MSRSWNHIELLGNLTRDPELRKTPKGTSVVGFGMATNWSWTTDTGERTEEPSFHRIIAWGPLAEQCAKYLKKGSHVFVSGRLSYRSFTTKDTDEKRDVTEIIISDMLMLDKKGSAEPVNTPKGRTAEDIYDDGDAGEQIPF